MTSEENKETNIDETTVSENTELNQESTESVKNTVSESVDQNDTAQDLSEDSSDSEETTEENITDIDIIKQLDEEKKKSAGYLDQLKRLNAEFDNFRKREEKNKLALKELITENIIQDFLPVIDNFERALACADNENTTLKTFIEGMEMVHNQSEEFLRNNNVKKMTALGEPFNPNLHDAVSKMHSGEFSEDTVMQVMQNGWYLGEKVIRHAMVVVSAGEDQSSKNNEDETNGES